MRVMSFMNLKGGSGKSSSLVHACVEALRRGLKVLVVDTDDPQYSACLWAAARVRVHANALAKATRRGRKTPVTELSPVVIRSPASKLRGVLDKARVDGFDLVLVDTSPRLGPNAVDVARLSDRVIVPVRPDPFDLASVQATIDLIKREDVQGLLFLTCCPHNAPEVAQTRELLALKGLPVASASLGLRRTFTRAVLAGKSAAEYEPRGKAAEEMAALIKELLE